MHIDRMKRKELMRRQGQTRRALMQIVWLLVSFAIAFVAFQYLVAQGILTYPFLYRNFAIPATVPNWIVAAVVILLLVVVIQFFVYFGYFLTSFEGRKRPGDPTTYSRDPEPPERYDD